VRAFIKELIIGIIIFGIFFNCVLIIMKCGDEHEPGKRDRPPIEQFEGEDEEDDEIALTILAERYKS